MSEHLDERSFLRARRRYLLAWIALLVLLVASAVAAQWHLGAANLGISMAIAAVKAAVVGWIYMQLDEAPRLQRIVIATSGAALVVLMSLSTIDFSARTVERTAWQQPQAVGAVLLEKPGAASAPR